MRPIRHIALLGATILVLAACGSTASGATAPTLPTSSATSAEATPDVTTTTMAVDPEEAAQEYATCMREHGIEMPDPGTGGSLSVGGDDFDFEALEAAGEACDPILENAFGEFELTPEQEAEMRDQQFEFAKCMRNNGVEDWPDPNADGMTAIEPGDDIDLEEVSATMDHCSQEVYGTSAGGAVVRGGATESGEATP